MAADVLSPLLGLLLQGDGNNPNSWGSNLNNQVFLPLERAVAGIYEIDVNGTVGDDIELSFNDARNATIAITGELDANKVIIVPSTANRWTFANLTTGDFFIRVRRASDTVYRSLPQGKFTKIVNFGVSGAIFREDADKVGEIFFHGGPTAPPGALACDGSVYKRELLPDLYGEIGVTWGSTDSSNFKVPPGDDTGRFVRGVGSGTSVGDVQSNQNKAHDHTGSGTTSLESSSHTHSGSGTTGIENNTHTHGYQSSLSIYGISTNSGNSIYVAYNPSYFNTVGQSANHIHSFSFVTGLASGYHSHNYSFTTSLEGGSEARPEAIVGLLCIRY